jgi:hypothetical protein
MLMKRFFTLKERNPLPNQVAQIVIKIKHSKRLCILGGMLYSIEDNTFYSYVFNIRVPISQVFFWYPDDNNDAEGIPIKKDLTIFP